MIDPEDAPPCDTDAPERQTAPVVFASPHSGRAYPEWFLQAARLDRVAIRRSEDAFMDEVFGSAPRYGAPLLRAHFPRALVDPNREAFELDPRMFEDRLPAYVNSTSPRVGAGLGTIARVVTSGEEIYNRKLRFEEAEALIERYYRPYHAALQRLVDDTRQRFGACLLVDCHSMPSVGGPMDNDTGHRRVDMVLGDRFGTSCAGFVTEIVRQFLTEQGYVVTRNDPYAGGYTTRHYGRPDDGVHALQIEVNRQLYMDEKAIERGPGLADLQRAVEGLVRLLTGIEAQRLVP